VAVDRGGSCGVKREEKREKKEREREKVTEYEKEIINKTLSLSFSKKNK
jgi:hypothetical protein